MEKRALCGFVSANLTLLFAISKYILLNSLKAMKIGVKDACAVSLTARNGGCHIVWNEEYGMSIL